MQSNNTKSGNKQVKKKNKDSTFKPESNQPIIKNVITMKSSRPKLTSSILPKSVQKRLSDPTVPIHQKPKKHEPPTLPERPVPAKRIIMDPDKQNQPEPPNGATGNNDTSKEVVLVKAEPELSPELQHLHELLQGDMERMMIKPLKDRMTKLENLKKRLGSIENKLQSNNIILHGIEDQVWETFEVTKEKSLIAISHTATGNTPQEKLDIMRKIGFKDIRRLGEYRSNRKHPILLEFEQKASADFLLQNKKQLPKEIYADKEYSQEVERERCKLRPILWKAKQLSEFKMKSKLDGDKLVVKGKTCSSNNLYLLPEPLTGYNVSKKEDENLQ